MSPQDKLLDKLSKMKASADGERKLGNEAAAEAFAEAINRLLLQHELSEADIPIDGVKDEPIVDRFVDLAEHGIKQTRSRIGWQEVLARIVAKAHLCSFFCYPGSNAISFVGTAAHVAVASYAYGILLSSAARMSVRARDDYWKAHRDDPDFESGNFRAAWLSGFIQRIGERFDEAKKAEVAAAASSSTALMRLDGALVRAKAYTEQHGTGKVAAPRMSGGSELGVREGRKAADQMKLGQKGVEAGGRKELV